MDSEKTTIFAADFIKNNYIAAMQIHKFDILAGLNILGSRCLECNSYLSMSGIALTRSPRTKGLPMSARGWNDRFRPFI